MFGMGTGVTLSTKSPENLKEHLPPKGFENRIVTVSGFKLCEALSNFLLTGVMLQSKFHGQALGTLVLVNLTCYHAYIPSLSTSWSTRSLTGRTNLWSGFTLRCIQRLSMLDIATERYGWRHNSYTRGRSNPVLSY